MKKFYFMLVALLTAFGLTANAADVVKAGQRYDITETGSVDIEFDTEEAVPDGKSVVVFYYTSDPAHPFLFGTNYKSCAYNNEDGYVRMWCKMAHNKKANGAEHLNIYGYVTAGEYWCYTICDDADVETVASPLGGGEGGGEGNKRPTPVVITKGATVTPSTVYDLPFSGMTGYVSDNLVTLNPGATADQYVVVFLNAPSVTTKIIDFKNIFYTAADKNYAAGASIENSEDGTFSFRRYYCQGAQAQLDVYAEDMNGYDAGYTWSYAIVNSLDEVSTVKNPYDLGGGSTPDPDPVVPGQDIENAIVLTVGTPAEFKTSGDRNVVYVKIVPTDDGTVTMNVSGEPNNKKWMEEGVMQYGALKQNYFTNGNQFDVVAGKTYYCLYNYAEATEGTISYAMATAEEGETRGKAIILTANCDQNLHGVAHSDDDYFDTTTWFKLDNAALAGMKLMTIKIAGNNETWIKLWKGEEEIKSYAMGTGSGMLAKNSTVQFDIDLSEGEYYVSISQDDVNGVATFTFSDVVPGQSIGTAIDAVLGNNSVAKNAWYKYTHVGEPKMVSVSGVNTIVNADEGLVAQDDDVRIGFVMGDGETIYFQATTIGFTISEREIVDGEMADKPLDITGKDDFAFTLNGGASDALRYMKYVASEDGTFMYGTTNAKVIENAFGASVKDVTTGKTVNIVQEEADFGEPYFIYTWTVTAGHEYLVEQTLVNNLGTVQFLTVFTPAEPGETAGKAIDIALNVPQDLGRKAAKAKFFKFTAEEAGEYLVSAQVTGYVRQYDAEGNSETIQKDYANGTEFHNATVTLAEGESVVFSCEPSGEIEHVAGGVQDFFIPNYYALVSKVGDVNLGMDISNPEVIEPNDNMAIDTYNIWYGPIVVNADEPLVVKVAGYEASNESAAVFFANEQGQWINKSDDIAYAVDGNNHVYTLYAKDEARIIYLMSSGVTAGGSWLYNNGQDAVDPEPEIQYSFDVTPALAIDYDRNLLTATFTVPATVSDETGENTIATPQIGIFAENATCATTQATLEYRGGEGSYNVGDEVVFTFSIPEGALVEGENEVTVNFECYDPKNVTINVKPATVLMATPIVVELGAPVFGEQIAEGAEIAAADWQGIELSFPENNLGDVVLKEGETIEVVATANLYDRERNAYPTTISFVGEKLEAARICAMTTLADGMGYTFEIAAGALKVQKITAGPVEDEITTLWMNDEAITLSFSTAEVKVIEVAGVFADAEEYDLTVTKTANISVAATNVEDNYIVAIEGVVYDREGFSAPVVAQGTIADGVNIDLSGLSYDKAYTLYINTLQIGDDAEWFYSAKAEDDTPLYLINFATKKAPIISNVKIGTPTLAVVDQRINITFVDNNFAETCPEIDFNNCSELAFACPVEIFCDGTDINNVYVADNWVVNPNGGPIAISQTMAQGGHYKVTIPEASLIITTYTDGDFLGKVVYTNAEAIVMEFDYDGPTAIAGVSTAADASVKVFSLSGVRLNTVQKGQINIVGGKKVFIRK